MQVTDVRAVIAIGVRGQFGLRGRLPWEGNRGREYLADVERFFELTRGHVLIMGHRTFISVPDFAFKDRDIVEIHASNRPENMLARFPSRVVFIGGGPPVYAGIGTSTGCSMTAMPTAGSIPFGSSRVAIGWSEKGHNIRHRAMAKIASSSVGAFRETGAP
jgi:dihydromethanopterin reductase